VSASRLRAARILIVDDEPAVRRFAARVLQEHGYAVHEASDGVDALDLVRAGEPNVHVVVSDIVMPRLNGVELMRALATSHPGLPMILMSGYATAQLEAMGIPAPCAILPKPFPAERLVEEVRRCLSEAESVRLPGERVTPV
jgi:two-component system cell cycle sensor histidine kinase/response regulator CckA